MAVELDLERVVCRLSEIEGGDEERRGSDSLDDDRDVRASPLDGIDLFE